MSPILSENEKQEIIHKTSMTLEQARTLADEIVEVLKPYCERVEIAGSIRRLKREGIKDIEIVCIPRIDDISSNLTGEPMPVNVLDDEINALVRRSDTNFMLGDRDKAGKKAPCGPRYYRLKYKGVKLDIFAVLPPAQWGTVFLIRTGDADFSHAFVTRLWDYGLRCKDGHIEAAHISNIPIVGKTRVFSTPEETDAFRLAGMDYIEPENRTLEAFRKTK